MDQGICTDLIIIVHEQGGKCMFAYNSLSVKEVFQVLHINFFFKMGTEIRMAYRAKHKMLSVVLECFSKLQVKIFYQLQVCTHTFCSVLFISMVGWGMVGQSRSLGWNRKSKIGDSAIVSSLPFTPETKMSSGSLYPTILNLPHPTLLHILVELLLVRIQILLCCFKSFL